MPNHKLGFIGAGKMATALAAGAVASKFVNGSEIAASDPSVEVGKRFAENVSGAAVGADNVEIARSSDCLVLAIKPHIVAPALASISSSLEHSPLIISIAAGIPLEKLAVLLPSGARIVRVMPNTPALVGHGVSGFAMGDTCTPADKEFVLGLLSGVGSCYEVPERLIDAVTGVSGSGPAFVYTFIEALADGAVRCGLPRDIASRMAAETVAGAAAMVLETGDHPGVLRDAVTSPGGTTIEGLAALEDHGLRAALFAATEAATNRAQELGRSN